MNPQRELINELSQLGFKAAFKATLGYHAANFIAGLVSLSTFAAFLFGIGLLIKKLF